MLSSRHTATQCNTLHHIQPHCNTLQHTATHSTTLQHTATHCNTLQHTANTLQHTELTSTHHSYMYSSTSTNFSQVGTLQNSLPARYTCWKSECHEPTHRDVTNPLTEVSSKPTHRSISSKRRSKIIFISQVSTLQNSLPTSEILPTFVKSHILVECYDYTPPVEGSSVV